MSIKFDNDKRPYIDLGQNYKINLNYDGIVDEKYLAKSREELRETPEIREQALKELRELIKSEKNLAFPTDDFFLETYLRPCKFYAKSAFEKIQTESKFKLKYEKFYENIDVEATRPIFEDGVFRLTPLTDKEGRRNLIVHCGDKWKMSRSNQKEVFNALQILFLSAAAEPLTQVNGINIILDMSRLSLRHLTSVTPSFAAMLMKWSQECIPLRIKNIFIVNNSKMFNLFWAILTPFLSAKLTERVHFVNQKYEILAEYMGKDCLFKEYDGNIPVENADGSVLTDFFKLYEKQFELISICGYVDQNENIEERRSKVNSCAEKILNFIKV
ncbi:retinaldehyde-binding protein 1-like [Chironomus tepperi]|uniref:retinaldehyde-binding protein 1-like n=1 Tax=Chironomus tepperi TaxID=113505 RepID=UPI00391EF28F